MDGQDSANQHVRINGVPLRDSVDALKVNYLSLEISTGSGEKVGYKNSWVTDKGITEENAQHNVLKNRG